MGLRDKVKGRKSEKGQSEEIGGLNLADRGSAARAGDVVEVDENAPPQDHSDGPMGEQESPEPVVSAPEENGGAKIDERKEPDLGSSLDIFSAESEGGEEENSLLKSLPEVDVNDLLRECQEIASRLRGGLE